MLISRYVLAACSGALILVLAAWSYRDYRDWLSLGPGGLPPTFGGWLTTLWRQLQGHDPFDVQRLERTVGTADDHAHLADIGIRRGMRPRVGHWPIPQRQLDQLAAPRIKQATVGLFEARLAAHSHLLGRRVSIFEKHNEALVLLEPDSGGPAAKRTRGEIGHIHPSDGSMHMTLSPSDAKIIIERGWGQAHSLAGRGALPHTYMFIYPPRNEQELAVTARILDAAIAYICGVPIERR